MAAIKPLHATHIYFCDNFKAVLAYSEAIQGACLVQSMLQVSELKNHSSDKGLRCKVQETLHLCADWSKFLIWHQEKLRNPIDLNGKNSSAHPR